MRKYISITVILCTIIQICYAQKASDVLENGISIKSGQKLFLEFDTKKKALLFDPAKSLQDPTNPPDFTFLEDSLIFLATKNALNIYLRPLNPLNFSYNTEFKIIVDPINESAASALGSIIDVLNSTVPKKAVDPKAKIDKALFIEPGFEKCNEFDTIQSKIDNLAKTLKDSKKSTVIEIFTKLKELDFADENDTKAKLTPLKTSIEQLELHFKSVADTISYIQSLVSKYTCTYPEAFIAKYIFNDLLKELENTLESQKVRLANLKTSYQLVENAQIKASKGGGENGLRWCYKLESAPSTEGKITVYNITIKESGYILSNKDEIVSLESSDILKRTIRVRKYQQFVPEVSIGTVYTFFKYNTFGTTSDSTGQQYVATPTENSIRNFNVTAMLNFNFFIPNSAIHPLYQIGLGLNGGMPTLLTGIGIRSNINGLKRLAITGGIAMTWIKELDKLKVGDKVTGTSDIDKDLTFKFTWPPKPYIGLQINF